MFESLELRDIRVFLAVAEELHFGRAAERVGLTSSRVSQTVRLLETRVGGRLFERTSRRVKLTPLGEQFLNVAKTERKTERQPNCVADHLRWQAKTFVKGSRWSRC